VAGRWRGGIRVRRGGWPGIRGCRGWRGFWGEGFWWLAWGEDDGFAVLVVKVVYIGLKIQRKDAKAQRVQGFLGWGLCVREVFGFMFGAGVVVR